MRLARYQFVRAVGRRSGGSSGHQSVPEAVAFTLRRHRAGGLRGPTETPRANDARGLPGLGQLQVLQYTGKNHHSPARDLQSYHSAGQFHYCVSFIAVS